MTPALPTPYYERGGIVDPFPGMLGARQTRAGAVLITPSGATPKELASMLPNNTPSRRKGYKQSPEHIAKRIRRGSDHHSWRGDTISEKGGRSRALRALPIIGPCVDCGSENSERHHEDGNTLNNDLSNIVPLCHGCHARRHIERPRFRRAALANLEKARAAVWADRVDTEYRPGDSCPQCDHRLGVTSVRRRNGYKFTHIGCRKERGGCGFLAGSLKESGHD